MTRAAPYAGRKALLPTGQARDLIDGYRVSCIDQGTPLLMVDCRSADAAQLDLVALVKLRRQVGYLMGLGDVRTAGRPTLAVVLSLGPADADTPACRVAGVADRQKPALVAVDADIAGAIARSAALKESIVGIWVARNTPAATAIQVHSVPDSTDYVFPLSMPGSG